MLAMWTTGGRVVLVDEETGKILGTKDLVLGEAEDVAVHVDHRHPRRRRLPMFKVEGFGLRVQVTRLRAVRAHNLRFRIQGTGHEAASVSARSKVNLSTVCPLRTSAPSTTANQASQHPSATLCVRERERESTTDIRTPEKNQGR